MIERRFLLLTCAAGTVAASVLPGALPGGGARAQAPRQPLPNTPTTLMDAIKADQRLGRFALMLGRAGADARLREPGQWTVFAPTDAAFNWMPANLVSALEGSTGSEGVIDTSRAGSVTLQHIIPFAHTTQRFANRREEFQALNNGKLVVDGTRAPMQVQAISVPGVLGAPGVNAEGPANIVVADVAATNGVLHIIDNVLLP